MAIILVSACGGTTTTVDGGIDASALDAAARDGGAQDASAQDAAAPDASAQDAAPGEDAGAVDAGGSPTDAGPRIDGGVACDYLDLDIWIVSCGGRDLYARRFTAPDAPAGRCPDFFTLGADRFATIEAALGSQSCQTDCLRAAGTSVSLIRCGRRTGYIIYRDAEDSCPDVYETPDGLFGSVDEWNAAFPCP